MARRKIPKIGLETTTIKQCHELSPSDQNKTMVFGHLLCTTSTSSSNLPARQQVVWLVETAPAPWKATKPYAIRITEAYTKPLARIFSEIRFSTRSLIVLLSIPCFPPGLACSVKINGRVRTAFGGSSSRLIGIYFPKGIWG